MSASSPWFPSFIHSPSKYILHTYCESGTVLGTGVQQGTKEAVSARVKLTFPTFISEAQTETFPEGCMPPPAVLMTIRKLTVLSSLSHSPL